MVSIIIPAYNEEKTISKTIESVLKLNYPKEKLEIIVINDGSTDKTAEFVKTFKEVVLINKKNTGKANSVNIGIKKAKGEFIATLDADSFVESNALNYMLGYFEEDEKVAAVVLVLKVHEPENIIQSMQYIEYLVSAFFTKILSFLDAIMVTPGPFTVYKASIFEKIGYFDENNITEDTEIALRIQSAQYKIKSSYNTRVHTVSPVNIQKLLKQRIRWYTGFLENAYRYRFLCSKKYGDFGVLMFPMRLILLFLGLFIFVYTFSNATHTLYRYLYSGYLAGLPSFSIDLFYLQGYDLGLFFIVALLIFFVLYLISRQFNEQNPVVFFISYMVFSFLLIFFWLYIITRKCIMKMIGRQELWKGR
ncbi:MAG: glycosyltransferase family 2 protein [Candidatus Micrarchaeota archaeon]